MSAPGLDHVGVVSHDLQVLAAQYERLGFTLTPLARQADGRIGNRCAMLKHCYIELLAVVGPNARSTTLERFLARYAGVHILAFAIADEAIELARLQRAGIDAAAASQLERLVDDADPAGVKARFGLIQLPGQPEARINLVRHHTPDALWRAEFLRHANHAATLVEVEIAVAAPIESAARLSRLIGCVVIPDRRSGFDLDLPVGRVRLAEAADGGMAPYVRELTIATGDSNAAINRLLVDRKITHARHDNSVIVPPGAAGGISLRFVPSD